MSRLHGVFYGLWFLGKKFMVYGFWGKKLMVYGFPDPPKTPLLQFSVLVEENVWFPKRFRPQWVKTWGE